MVLQLKQLFDIEGEVKDIDCHIPIDDIKKQNLYEVFTAPIVIKGRAYNRAGILKLDFNCTFTLGHRCDRCLKKFEREYSYDFSHILVRSTNTDNDEYLVCENDTLDLDELAVSDLLLQLPTKILCREDCKGLCYVCGQDLNEGECDCPKE